MFQFQNILNLKLKTFVCSFLINCYFRHSSNSKASYEESLTGLSNGSRKKFSRNPALKNIVEMAKEMSFLYI